MKVEVIKAKKHNVITADELEKKRVAAYCRVSTELEEQEGSYKAQVEHYRTFITGHPDWRLAGIYADEGLSGTSTKKREEFNRMIKDCENGLIDMVITKSISRFARNTLDCLQYIRKLKALDIPVYFEKENINTLDSKGEILITIMASLAQQESQSISKNVKMGIDYRHQQGKFALDTNRFLGYDWDENHEHLIINKDEAEIVKRIYREFLEGKTLTLITKGLNADGIKTARGKEFSSSTVRNILTNEKYVGDVLMQKTVTVDVLTHRRIANDGREDQYYIKDDHEAIIDRDIYNLAQAEMQRRLKLSRNPGTRASIYSNLYALSGICYCGECGAKFRRFREKRKNGCRVIWKCKERMKHKENCDNRVILEADLQKGVMKAIKELLEKKADYISTLAKEIRKADIEADILEKRPGVIALEELLKEEANLNEFDDLLVRKVVKRVDIFKNCIKVELYGGMKIKI